MDTEVMEGFQAIILCGSLKKRKMVSVVTCGSKQTAVNPSGSSNTVTGKTFIFLAGFSDFVTFNDG